MLVPPYPNKTPPLNHDESLPDIDGRWLCVSLIVERMLPGLCSIADAICDLEEAMRRGLLRGKIQVCCDHRRINPSELDVIQLVLRDSPDGWVVEIACRETGEPILGSLYLWLPDHERLWSTESPPPKQSESTPRPRPEPKPKRAPDWLVLVTPCFDAVVGDKGRYPSRGSLRSAVKAELKSRKRRGPKDNRAYDRMLTRYRPHWFVIDGT
jgi:hypothetical protein